MHCFKIWLAPKVKREKNDNNINQLVGQIKKKNVFTLGNY